MLGIIATSLPTSDATFSDVPASYKYATAVTALQDLGVIAGYANNTYQPEIYVNRAEALKIILEAAYPNIPDATISKFPDVSTKDWFNKYTTFAKENNIISGYPDGTFRGADLINFSEILKISTRAFGVSSTSMYTAKEIATAFPKYTNNEWFLPYIMYAKQKNLLILQEPAAFPSRGEMAEIIFRLYIIQQLKLSAYDATLADQYVAINKAVKSLPDNPLYDVAPVTSTGTTMTGSGDTMTGSGTTVTAPGWDTIYFGVETEADGLTKPVELDLLNTSPLLTGSNPMLQFPFQLIQDPLARRDDLLQVINGLQNEADSLQSAWNKNAGLAQKYRDELNLYLLAIKTDINEVRTEIINKKEPISKDDANSIILKVLRLRKSVVKLHAKTYFFYVLHATESNDILNQLAPLSKYPEYQLIVAQFDLVREDLRKADAIIASIGDNSDEFLTFRQALDQISSTTTRFQQISALIKQLVQKASSGQ